MKKKQKQELRGKSQEELDSEARKIQEEISKLRLDLWSGKIKNTSSLRRKQDELAVILTIKKEKQLLNG